MSDALRPHVTRLMAAVRLNSGISLDTARLLLTLHWRNGSEVKLDVLGKYDAANYAAMREVMIYALFGPRRMHDRMLPITPDEESYLWNRIHAPEQIFGSTERATEE